MFYTSLQCLEYFMSRRPVCTVYSFNNLTFATYMTKIPFLTPLTFNYVSAQTAPGPAATPKPLLQFVFPIPESLGVC